MAAAVLAHGLLPLPFHKTQPAQTQPLAPRVRTLAAHSTRCRRTCRPRLRSIPGKPIYNMSDGSWRPFPIQAPDSRRSPGRDPRR